MGTKKNDFDIFKELTKSPVKNAIKVSTVVKSITSNKKTSKIEMILDKDSAQNLMKSAYGVGNKRYTAVLYVIDLDEYNKIDDSE